MKALQDKYLTSPESLSRTVQYWSEKDLSQDRWTNGVMEIVGLKGAPVFVSANEAKMFFLYSLEYLFNGDFYEPVVAWEVVRDKAEKLREKLPSSFRDEEVFESNLSGVKEVKPKRKTGQDCAAEWWTNNLSELAGMKPKDIQDRMAEECDLHRNSCRGIYYKLKKEFPIPA